MDKLIQSYDVEMGEPACMPGAPTWLVRARLHRNISEVLPYLNAKLEGGQYYAGAQVLIWENQGRKYAFRPDEIRIAPAEDREKAYQIVAEAVDKVNKIWQQRSEITPSFTERKLPNVIDIYKLLPKTNCKECGYPTCMAYAADLRQGKVRVDQCPLLLQQSYAENKNDLLRLLSVSSSFGGETEQASAIR